MRVHYGLNVLSTHVIRPIAVLWRQVKNPILILLLAAALVSGLTGGATNAIIIGVIVALSVGLGFFNEFAAEMAMVALRNQISHVAAAERDRKSTALDVAALVPGDIVMLNLGSLVPADVRIIETSDLECDEDVLTGESLPVVKSIQILGPAVASNPTNCAFMGTVVHQASGGGRRGCDRCAHRIWSDRRGAERTTGADRVRSCPRPVLAVLVPRRGVAHRGHLCDQRRSVPSPHRSSAPLPGDRNRHRSRDDAAHRDGQPVIGLESVGEEEGAGEAPRRYWTSATSSCCLPTRPEHSPKALSRSNTRWTVTGSTSNAYCCSACSAMSRHCPQGRRGDNALDQALWESTRDPARTAAANDAAAYLRVATLPFDHERQFGSVRVEAPDGSSLQVTKRAPEVLLERCRSVTPAARTTPSNCSLTARFVAVASRTLPTPDVTLGSSTNANLTSRGPSPSLISRAPAPAIRSSASKASASR